MNGLLCKTNVPALNTWGASELDLAIRRGTVFCFRYEFRMASTPIETVLHARLIHYAFEDFGGLFELNRDDSAPNLALDSYMVMPLADVRHVSGIWPSYLNTRIRSRRAGQLRARRLYPASH